MNTFKNILFFIFSIILMVHFSSCSPEIFKKKEQIGHITGTVTDAQKANFPLENATVTISPADKEFITRADGRFTFGNLKPDEYNVKVNLNGYASDFQTIIVSDGKISNCDFLLVQYHPELNAVLSKIEFLSFENEKFLQITNSGTGQVIYSAKPDKSWITLIPAEDTIFNEIVAITVKVNRNGLAFGTYEGKITIKSNANSVVVNVIMNNPKPENLATIETVPVTGITNNAVVSGGKIITDGGKSIKSKGLCWGLNPYPSINDSTSKEGPGNSYFLSIAGGLKPNTSYHLRAYAINDGGVAYGEDIPFTTNNFKAGKPEVKTLPMSKISHVTAEAAAEVTFDGGATIVRRGACWSVSGIPVIEDTHTSDSSGMGIFKSKLTGLKPVTVYYIRAYAKNSAGLTYGETVKFTTTPATLKPTITTAEISNISDATATGGGNVSSDGGEIITSRGLCWNTSGNPTLTDNYTKESGTAGAFISNMASLASKTTYFVKAYATNLNGTSYGNEVQFTTEGDMVYVEDFTLNPGFTALATATNWYDGTTGNYTVKAKNYYGKYWAYSPSFRAYDGKSDISIEFDVNFKNIDEDSYPGVTFYDGVPDCNSCTSMPSSNRVFSIQFMNTNLNPQQIRIVSDYPLPGFYSYNTPTIKEQIWYHVKLVYYGTKKLVDIEVVINSTNSVYYSVTKVPFDIVRFNYLAVGFYTYPLQMSGSEVAIDNVKIRKVVTK